MPVSARFAHNTTYYTLPAARFGDIAAEYPALAKAYNNVYSAALAAKERQDHALDYWVASENRFTCRYAQTLDYEQLRRCGTTLLNLKNAIMYYLARNRKDRKMPKLKDVLESVIA